MPAPQACPGTSRRFASYLIDTTTATASVWEGNTYADEATARQAIEDLMLGLFENNFESWLEYYAEAIGEAAG